MNESTVLLNLIVRLQAQILQLEDESGQAQVLIKSLKAQLVTPSQGAKPASDNS